MGSSGQDGASRGARYLLGDVAYFLSRSPYLSLSTAPRAARYLEREVEAAEECAHVLRQYPAVRIEPLAFFYTCLRSLGALDQPFFEALLRELNWRGAVWGSWLALLDPRDTFLDALCAAQPKWPYNQWLVDCAIATIEGRAPAPEFEVVVSLAARCRELLAPVRRPIVPLRPAPSAAEIARMNRERERIKACYESDGTDAALAAMRGTLVQYYAQDYERWVRSSLARGVIPIVTGAGRGR